MKNYRSRYADIELMLNLESNGAVLIEGPKWCGKTTTANQIAKSTLYLQDTDKKEQYQRIAKIKPSLLLEGETPRLIDEWQLAPKVWDTIRFRVDMDNITGGFILTGSTSVDRDSIDHSGTGRIGLMLMGTMSLSESGDSNRQISLNSMMNGDDVSGHSDLSLEDIAKLVVRGGWPESIGKTEQICKNKMKNYCKTLLKTDIHTVDGIKRDSEKMKLLLRSISRNISTQANDTTIWRDLTTNNEELHINTVRDYVRALKNLYVIMDLPAWSPKLRSKTTIRTSDTRHFCDPAIACYFLGASWKSLISDIRTFGLLFESMVVRDIRAYASALEADVYHYRDSDNLECDIIISFMDGSWGAIEAKLGDGEIDEAANNLLKIKNKVDLDENSLRFMAVVTATEYGYRRDDGIYVVPLGCLTCDGLIRD